MNRAMTVLFILCLPLLALAEQYQLALLQYDGGGDWYEARVGSKEFVRFINSTTSLTLDPVVAEVKAENPEIHDFPFIFLSGHGTIRFDEQQALRLRRHLLNGGFLFANDDYGLEESFYKAMETVFPDKEWQKVPLSHSLYSIYFDFPSGTPKVHQHDGGAPETWGLFDGERLMVLYIKNTDIIDGWAPYQVHKNPESVRIPALRFGVNILVQAMTF